MRKMSESFRAKNISIFLAIFVLLSDQLSKWIIVQSFACNNVIHILPFFNIVRVENKGITFGMLNELVSPFILTIVSNIVIVCLLVWVKKNLRYLLPICLIIGGAIGNAVDRVIHGAVIDFLDFHFFGYHWPAFNIADSSIVIGTFIWLFISYGEQS